MPEIKKKTLVERVLIYHSVDKPGDGNDGTLSVRDMAELGEGVVCVYDSLGEFDIFFDVDSWGVADSAEGRYSIMLESVKEGIIKYEKMRRNYRMVCVVQDQWDPASYLGRSSFSQAHEASKVLLKSKNPDARLYDAPRVRSSLN